MSIPIQKRINKLSIIHHVPFKGKTKIRRALCKCECGREEVKVLTYLVSDRDFIACTRCVLQKSALSGKVKPCKCGKLVMDHPQCKVCHAYICVESIATKPSPDKKLCEDCYNN